MKEDWTKQMKQKLDGHKMTPPAGLWENISNQMGLEPAPAPKPAIIRRWYWAAAAVVLALVGFFAFYNFDHVEPKIEANNDTTVKSSVHVVTDSEHFKEPTLPAETETSAKLTATAQPALLAMVTQNVSIEETNHEESVAKVEEFVEQPQPSAEEKAEKTEEKIEAQNEQKQKKQTYLPDVVEPTTTASRSDNSNRWTIGLAGSNGLLLAANDYANSMDMQPLYNDVSPATYYANKYADLAQAYTLTDVELKHHIPLRLGLSLQYQLNNRLALLSGISYTYLKSEFNFPEHSYYNYDQELRYLGIPIGISWKVWSANNFNIYLTGGTLIEKCISAEVSEGDISTKPWQWSVNASAGAEYNFTRQFGVYLEPSLGYYFNDGTKLEHYYKEHPLAPSLQFGLRLHLK